MPRGDGTGPNGQGPRTGRGLGTCKGSGGKYTNRTRVGRSRGGRRQGGRGRR